MIPAVQDVQQRRHQVVIGRCHPHAGALDGVISTQVEWIYWVASSKDAQPHEAIHDDLVAKQRRVGAALSQRLERQAQDIVRRIRRDAQPPG